MKPIANRRNIQKLHSLSNGFKDLRDTTWTSPNNFINWASNVSNNKKHQNFGFPNADSLFGKACGEAFGNFIAKKFGPGWGIVWERVGTER
jgi:hypothetical protein